MAMIPSENGWSYSLSRGLPTYIGTPCRHCGSKEKLTASRYCTNKCHLTVAREYKKRKKQLEGVSYKIVLPSNPQEVWDAHKTDFKKDDLAVSYDW